MCRPFEGMTPRTVLRERKRILSARRYRVAAWPRMKRPWKKYSTEQSEIVPARSREAQANGARSRTCENAFAARLRGRTTTGTAGPGVMRVRPSHRTDPHDGGRDWTASVHGNAEAPQDVGGEVGDAR